MAKRNSKKQQNPVVGTIIAVVVVVVGLIIYAVTGVDLLGVTGATPVPGVATSIATQPPAAITSAPTQAASAASGAVQTLTIGLGYGYQSAFWQVFFTSPSNTRDRSQYVNGIDVPVAAAIDAVRSTLDIAAFELNNVVITDAIQRAHERGVRIRIVTDNEHGIEDDDSTLTDLEVAGIPIVDDGRSALMHNKFMIMDGITVWMGSTNYTMNDVYRNNNNIIMLRSRRAVEVYQAEFNEMFERKQFGPRSDQSNTASFSQDGMPIEIYFAAENPVMDRIIAEISAARTSIRFLAFSFTEDALGDVVLAAAQRGVNVQGVFETTGSETEFSELKRLFCAGLDVRQDGNNGIMHHKVFVIDGQTVVAGSFNFSSNATRSNDENVIILRSADIATLYTQEFGRVQSVATPPDEVSCN
jgi:phosphatidylserine/phosphatidylglycerophosphate/cardiolipin synthase-like enzyme